MESWRHGEGVVYSPEDDEDTEHLEAIAAAAERTSDVEAIRGGATDELVKVTPVEPDGCGCSGCGSAAPVDLGHLLAVAEEFTIWFLVGIGLGWLIDQLGY